MKRLSGCTMLSIEFDSKGCNIVMILRAGDRSSEINVIFHRLIDKEVVGYVNRTFNPKRAFSRDCSFFLAPSRPSLACTGEGESRNARRATQGSGFFSPAWSHRCARPAH